MSEGTVVEKKKFYKKWWFWVLIIFVIGLIGSSGDTPISTPTNTQTPVVQKEKGVEVIKVTAPQLAKAYKDNGVSADVTYKNKMVEISGTVKNISKDILDDAYITLSGDSNSFTDIQCMFSADNENSLISLKEGSKVVVRGEVSSMLLNVLVRDCVLITN